MPVAVNVTNMDDIPQEGLHVYAFEGVTYTLDIASLTQVLSDGENAYLYGAGRIAEQGSGGWQYPLGDALGSMRQLTDSDGYVMLVKAYEPFGSVLTSIGDSNTNYGFTGEWADSYIKLIYLRSRYYAPGQGRFLSRDMWEGDIHQPMSYNFWLYVYGNPLSYSDPSGKYGREIHTDLTIELGQSVAPKYCQGLACVMVPEISKMIAMADQRMDGEFELVPNPLHSGFTFHFGTLEEAWRDVAAASDLSEPTFLGASLHEIQDYFSHRAEGYRWPLGHALDTVNATLRPQWFIDKFYKEHPEDDLRLTLAKVYTYADVRRVNRDKLIDLYLYTFSEPSSFEREFWGYDTDHYFGFTPRDL